MEHKTRAGIDWVGNSVAAAVKIALDRLTVAYFDGFGVDEATLRGNWDSLVPGTGFMGRRGQMFLAERIEHLVPDFRPYFTARSSHSGGIGYALCHRARWTIKKAEVARFKAPEWRPFYRLVRESVFGDTPITAARRYAAHEEVVLLQIGDKPGVYVNRSSGSPTWYLGEGSNVAKRSMSGHRNGDMYLTRVYVTGDKATAVALQNSLFAYLDRIGVIEETRYRSHASGPARGAFRCAEGLDLVDLLDAEVRAHYSEFCRATVGIP